LDFESIIFRSAGDIGEIDHDNDIFEDFSLKKIFKGIMGNIPDTDFEKLLYTPVPDMDNIIYRQDIFRDLRNPKILKALTQFSEDSSMIFYNINKLGDLYRLQRERWLLDSVSLYCNSLLTLYNELNDANIVSEGLRGVREYIGKYMESNEFKSLMTDTSHLENSMSSLRYMMTIRGVRITVRRDREFDDYGHEVIELFSRFLDDDEVDYGYSAKSGFGHVEAAVVELVSKLYPEQFNTLKEFYKLRINFMDPVIKKFMHEIDFYLKYLRYIRPMEESGLSFCIPEILPTREKMYCTDFFDMALADKLIKHQRIPVTNSFLIDQHSHIIIVTGPNNGGKTTFARAFGQAHYLALLGFPIPGKEAAILKADNIYSHFEKSEDPGNYMGRLEEELVRIHGILQSADDKSLIIINEMLSSTTLKDGIEIGKSIIEKIREKGSICLYVTFIHELSEFPGTKSYVSQVDRHNPDIRTYRIIGQKSNGMAYANALAEKYGVTYDTLRRRIKQ
jgi:DNA mismatch repair ATPase MutS